MHAFKRGDVVTCMYDKSLLTSSPWSPQLVKYRQYVIADVHSDGLTVSLVGFDAGLKFSTARFMAAVGIPNFED